MGRLFRKPSLKKSLSARTTGKWKRAAKRKFIPGYGKKGTGLLKNPTRHFYNKMYYRGTRSALKRTTSKAHRNSNKRKTAKDSKGNYTFLLILLLVGGICGCCNDGKEAENVMYDDIQNVNSESASDFQIEENGTESEIESVKKEDKQNLDTNTYFHKFHKEGFKDEECGINNFLINYNRIAKYNYSKADIKELLKYENPISRLENYDLECGVRTNYSSRNMSGYELLYHCSSKGNADTDVMKKILGDSLKAIDKSISKEEISYLHKKILKSYKLGYGGYRIFIRDNMQIQGIYEKEYNDYSFTIFYNNIGNRFTESQMREEYGLLKDKMKK